MKLSNFELRRLERERTFIWNDTDVFDVFLDSKDGRVLTISLRTRFVKVAEKQGQRRRRCSLLLVSLSQPVLQLVPFDVFWDML